MVFLTLASGTETLLANPLLPRYLYGDDSPFNRKTELWDGAKGIGSGGWYFERSSLGSSAARAVPDGGATAWMVGLSALTIAFVQKWRANAGNSDDGAIRWRPVK